MVSIRMDWYNKLNCIGEKGRTGLEWPAHFLVTRLVSSVWSYAVVANVAIHARISVHALGIEYLIR